MVPVVSEKNVDSLNTMLCIAAQAEMALNTVSVLQLPLVGAP